MKLSPKMIQILDGVAAGKSNKVIAWETGLAIGTVKQYLCRTLCPRLGAENRTQLGVRWATAKLKQERGHDQ